MRSVSKRTIAKFLFFVIFSAVISGMSASCSATSGERVDAFGNGDHAAPEVRGVIKDDDIRESSGLAASKCNPNVFWTHNDSGNSAVIFALDDKGQTIGRWKVDGAKNIDWEDIASYKDTAGKCFLFIGEIGDNENKRNVHAVYRVSEPQVTVSSANSNGKPNDTQPVETLRFSYPDGNHNAETLMVHPMSGYLYVLTKIVSGPAGVYRLKPEFGSDEVQVAEKVAEIAVPAIPNGFLTGGDISPDGKRVIVCDYSGAFELGLPDADDNFDAVWAQTPTTVDIGSREHGEAVCYGADGNSIYATSEKKNSPFIRVRRK